jgi:hypothetical protein
VAASNYPDGAVAVDWHQLASDYEIFCYVAYTAARGAGRRGPLTPEMAARWWLDLYRAGRQGPWLERAARELLQQERIDLGIAVSPGWPVNDDSWSGVVAGLSPQTPPGPMIGPTAGVGLVTDLDRMTKRLLAREAAASAVECKPASSPAPSRSAADLSGVIGEKNESGSGTSSTTAPDSVSQLAMATTTGTKRRAPRRLSSPSTDAAPMASSRACWSIHAAAAANVAVLI